MIKKINDIYNDFINDIFSTANKEIQHQKENLSYININNNETSNQKKSVINSNNNNNKNNTIIKNKSRNFTFEENLSEKENKRKITNKHI